MRGSARLQIGSQMWHEAKCAEGDCQVFGQTEAEIGKRIIRSYGAKLSDAEVTQYMLSGTCGPTCRHKN